MAQAYQSKFITIGDKLAVTDGPLSAEIAKQLNQAYKRELDEATGIIVETIVNDQVELASSWLAAQIGSNAISPNNPAHTYVFGIAQSDAKPSDVIELSDSLSDMTDEQKSNTVVYIEPTGEKGSSIVLESIKKIARKNKIKLTQDMQSLYNFVTRS